jgi:phosphopantothenoylcysteine decarboxylase/phosphopantothenate--cysteine ligase
MTASGGPALSSHKRVVLIVGGGIAAYKTPELIRRAGEHGIATRVVLTAAGAQFVTPLTLGSVSGDKVFTELFSLTDEAEMGHIRLSREADLLVVAPATADLMAKMAHGLADDLASTVLLATDKPVLIAPAMNPEMWAHAATRRNLATLRADGIRVVGPNPGEMACGEEGLGRMAEPHEILAAILDHYTTRAGLLAGRRVLVTSGPTHEPIDPVRFIANHSSGRQGHAIAAACAAAGAAVTLVHGPVALADPPQVTTVKVTTAQEMLAACEAALPVDVAICAAAVADWRPEALPAEKIKKIEGEPPPSLRLVENPDILRRLGTHPSQRPGLVVGFAAETGALLDKARAKLARKGCDWILANEVGADAGTFGGAFNQVTLLTADGRVESWPRLAKEAVAAELVARIAAALGTADRAA